MSVLISHGWYSLDMKKTLFVLGGSFNSSCLWSVFSPFDSLWTYLFGFLATIATRGMILSARIPMKRRARQKETSHPFLWQITSYGVYFSNRPFLYHLPQTFGVMMAA